MPIRPNTFATRPVQPGDWEVVARLFGTNGACGGCWCMWWRVPKGGKAWEEAKGAKNRDRFRKLFRSGEVHGVLAFDGDEPVGWCSIGPRDTFPRIESIQALRGEAPPQTWAVVCFYIPSKWRGKGVATALLLAAKGLAFEHGARIVEGYPMVPSSREGKMPAAFAWTGVPEVFRRAGFTKGKGGTATRPIYRAALRPAKADS